MQIRQMEIDQPGSSLLFQGAALQNNLNAVIRNKFLNNRAEFRFFKRRIQKVL
jgi:hypothetical protein